jgi:hypothetical protein
VYVLKRNEDGAYVAQPGSASSYTNNIRAARKFPTREAAQADACGNEHVADIYAEVGHA